MVTGGQWADGRGQGSVSRLDSSNQLGQSRKKSKYAQFCHSVKTGIQSFQALNPLWIPAYAGMTDLLRVQTHSAKENTMQ